jgi:hypothetical protein
MLTYASVFVCGRLGRQAKLRQQHLLLYANEGDAVPIATVLLDDVMVDLVPADLADNELWSPGAPHPPMHIRTYMHTHTHTHTDRSTYATYASMQVCRWPLGGAGRCGPCTMLCVAVCGTC